MLTTSKTVSNSVLPRLRNSQRAAIEKKYTEAVKSYFSQSGKFNSFLLKRSKKVIAKYIVDLHYCMIFKISKYIYFLKIIFVNLRLNLKQQQQQKPLEDNNAWHTRATKSIYLGSEKAKPGRNFPIQSASTLLMSVFILNLMGS